MGGLRFVAFGTFERQPLLPCTTNIIYAGSKGEEASWKVEWELLLLFATLLDYLIQLMACIGK